MSSAPDQPALEELLDRADTYAREGDAKSAASFYQAALVAARAAPLNSAAAMSRLQAAQEYLRSRAAEFESKLAHALDGIEPADECSRIRLSHSLDMLRGRREIYPQQPSVLYYPYLSQRQFFDREEFDWVLALEAQTDAIREELLALLHEDAEFRPYVQDAENRPRRDFHGLNNSPSWTALYLWQDGELVEENARRCPRTVEALRQVPLSKVGRYTPSVLFSRLQPGAHIPPHGGMLNCRLICHLPLIVPEGCWLRVGNETREWEEGKLLIFDDSIEHEAKNPTGELRIILLFDIWRPELTDAEKQGISAMFNAIDDFQTLPDA